MKLIKLFRSLTFNIVSGGAQRSVDAKRNIIGSLIIKGLSFGIQFALVPLTINYVTPTKYGVWLTLSSIVAWFALFDMGLGNGLRNKFAEAMAKKDINLARTYLSTTYAIVAIIFFIVFLAFLLFSQFSDWSSILNAPQTLSEELGIVAMVVFGFFSMQFVLQIVGIVITAIQKPSITDFMQMMSQLVSLIIVFVLAKFSNGSLLFLGIAMTAAPVAVYLSASLFLFNRNYKYISPNRHFINFAYGKDLFGIGIKFFFIQIAFIGIFQTNNIIIAQVCSPLDVTVFSIANKYMSMTFIIFSIFISPLWSAFTEAYTVKDYSWMQNTVKKLNLFAFFPLISSLFLAIISGYVYRIWIGDSVSIPSEVTYAMAVYIIVSCWVPLYTHILNGVGKVVVQLITYSVSMLLHIPIALYLGQKWGINGVILSASTFLTIIALVSFIQVHKIIYKKETGIWAR